MNDHNTTQMNEPSETTEKKVNPKHKKYYESHKRQIYIRNLLKVKNKPSQKKWEEYEVKEEDFEDSQHYWNLYYKIYPKEQPCLITDDDEEEEQQPVEESKSEPEPDQAFIASFIEESNKWTPDETKQAFDFLKSKMTEQITVNIQYFPSDDDSRPARKKPMVETTFIKSSVLSNPETVPKFTSNDIIEFQRNRVIKGELKKNSHCDKTNYEMALAKVPFTSEDLINNKDDIHQTIMNRRDLRDGIQGYFTQTKLKLNSHIKPIYDKFENDRKKKETEKQQKQENRKILEPLKVTQKQIEELTDKLTNSNDPKDRVKCLLLRLYSIAHVRNDFHELKLHRSIFYSETGNAIILLPAESLLILNNFKTDKRYGQKEYTIDKTTHDLLHLHCKDKKDGDYIFPDLKNDTKCSKYFRQIFKDHLDIDLHISDLRAAYVTHAHRKYADGTYVLSIKERKDIADNMLHTLGIAESTYLREASIEIVPLSS